MESRDSLNPSALSLVSAPFDPYNIDNYDNIDSFNLALDDEPLFPADWDQDQETPSYDGGLYSTPLNWEAPVEPKFEPKVETLPPTPFTTMNTLTPAQQEKLRNIAMPQHLQYRGENSPNSTASNKSRSISSPENHEQEARSRKRKSSDSAEDDDDEDSNPPVKKTAHNMIEKRYRTNLNDKIAALRDSVPSLRIMNKRAGDNADDMEDLQGLTPAHKSNKATVLSKATEYIHHLEKRNKRLQDDNNEQKARLAAFETLFNSGAMGYRPAPMPQGYHQFNPDYSTPSQSPGGLEPQGMIHVPDDIRRLQGQMHQQPFAVPQEQYQQQQARPMVQNGWQHAPYFGKLMVGSLAGLMFFEGMREAEQKEDSPNARGLSALPIQLFKGLGKFFHSSMELQVAGYHVQAATTLAYMKLFLIVGALLCTFIPSLFSSKPKSNGGKKQIATLATAPSLASPIQVRRQAWLTAIQTVWVPRHKFFLEAAALCLKIAKLSLRNLIGAQGYAYLTGVTDEEEAARQKAWAIALDAQLAGGDVEISKSRLLLTLLASYTLPKTPIRLMLRALHFRLTLWEVGTSDPSFFYVVQELAARLAQWQWNEAKNLQRSLTNNKTKQEDPLPDYLLTLLEQDSKDVLSDVISQRAHNLAWNLPTGHNIESPTENMNGVVEDQAIRSPLDAVAAWYSGIILRLALTASLPGVSTKETGNSMENVTLAMNTAPTGSVACSRALIAKTILMHGDRPSSINDVKLALGNLGSTKYSVLINSANTGGMSVTDVLDFGMSIRCAIAMANIERSSTPTNLDMIQKSIAAVRPRKMTLLGFTAAFKLMETINDNDKLASECTRAMEQLASRLRLWVGGKDGEKSHLNNEAKRAVIERCLNIQKRLICMEDAGYESMIDDTEESC